MAAGEERGGGLTRSGRGVRGSCLTALPVTLIKIGAEVIHHSRRVVSQRAEVAVRGSSLR